ncbi:carbonyl reductase [NADPH] 3-like [Bicyclus anynana]|uniref:carbonyl reductase (NADPH) n=1 Tax=Bicyclus anynana TaxID=110368 RepID=A0A6J1NXN7_BICAN|nr:carbonyl reductase [NADPH] 3-like [Bicyclus anynana]
MSSKVAIVTGGNKGIGLATVRGLCQRFEGIVYLTSRDVARGEKAVSDLQKEGLNPKYHQLDISDNKSVEVFRDYIKETYGGIDVLVNNAAIHYPRDSTVPISVKAEQTLFVNYFSTLSTCEILFPILRDGARVVNVSSSAGRLNHILNQELRQKFEDPTLTIPELSNLMRDYVDAAKLGTHAADWGNSSYAVSKVGLNALTKVQQRLLNDRDIKVNAVHPGFVDTDMSLHKGTLSVEEGARGPLYLALDAPDSVRGQYLWYDTTIVSWYDGTPIEKSETTVVQ